MSGDRIIVPIVLREAHAFVKAHHRHHDPDRGAKFAIAVALDAAIVAVACVGRPKARMLDNGFTVEVTRLCSIDVGVIVGADGREHAPQPARCSTPLVGAPRERWATASS